MDHLAGMASGLGVLMPGSARECKTPVGPLARWPVTAGGQCRRMRGRARGCNVRLACYPVGPRGVWHYPCEETVNPLWDKE